MGIGSSGVLGGVGGSGAGGIGSSSVIVDVEGGG